MKIYVHYELSEPEYTLPINLDVCTDTRTVSEIKNEFVNAYNARFGADIQPELFALSTSKQKHLPSNERIVTLVKPNTDLFLAARKAEPKSVQPVTNKAASKPNAPAAEAATAKPSITAEGAKASAMATLDKAASAGTQQIQAAEQKSSPVAAGKSASTQSQAAKSKWTRPKVQNLVVPAQVEQWVKESLEVARQVKEKGSIRQACEAWRQILAVSPANIDCLEGLAQAAFDAARYEEAIDYWCQAMAMHPPKDERLVKTGRAALALSDWNAALHMFNRAMELRLDKDPDDPCEDLQVLLAKTLYGSGAQDAAIQLLTSVLQRNDNNDDAVIAYAQAYIDRGRGGEALRFLLRALVHSPSNQSARQLISALVRSPGGLGTLLEELGDATKSGPALAFLATLVKDYGAVEESVALYYRALEASPGMASYCLNLVHTLEVCNRYQEAFDLALRFCREQAAMTVGGHYTNGQVAALYESVGDIYDAKYQPAGGTHPDLQRTPYWIPNLGAVIMDRAQVAAEEAAAAAGGGEGDGGARQRESTALPSPAAAAPAKHLQKLPPYSADELDLLALHFTLVKILYVAGALALIPAGVELVERARRGWDLHLTTIRNEHAYFCDVAQLMASTVVTPPPAEADVLYVAGDSHCLSAGWQVITWRGRRTRLVPKLVTGLKCWHLRPESLFFPKHNFHSVVGSIPRGAAVLFLFGEIDCREGIITAVEKGRYRDLEEGVACTIDFYLAALLSLHRDRGFEVYVQPVAPVLNETREVVRVFNRVLRDKVRAAAPALAFLDFFDQLLTPDGRALHADYELDGTHMHPRYCRLIESALNDLPPLPTPAGPDSDKTRH